MSKPTAEQLCEFFRQIAEGMITKDTVQEVIERGCELALSQLKSQITTQALNLAKILAVPEQKAIALVEWTLASQNTSALDEIRELLSNFTIPNLDLAGIAKLTQDPQDELWAYEQYLRIVFPQRRAERLARLACAFPFESDKYLVKAGESVSEIGDEGDRNDVRSQIVGSLAQTGRLALARKAANEIGMPYWRARAFVKIYRFSEKEEDREEVIKSVEQVTNYWASNVYKELTIALSELDDLSKAWQMLAKIKMRDWIPDALLAIIKTAVKVGNESSVHKGMHMLLADEYRWWRTKAHLLIAAGVKGKVDKAYLEKIRRSILLCQDVGHRAEIYAGLAAISRNPSDLKEAYNEALSITIPHEQAKALAAILKAFK